MLSILVLAHTLITDREEQNAKPGLHVCKPGFAFFSILFHSVADGLPRGCQSPCLPARRSLPQLPRTQAIRALHPESKRGRYVTTPHPQLRLKIFVSTEIHILTQEHVRPIITPHSSSIRPHRLVVRTAGSHPANRGSIPRGVTN